MVKFLNLNSCEGLAILLYNLRTYYCYWHATSDIEEFQVPIPGILVENYSWLLHEQTRYYMT